MPNRHASLVSHTILNRLKAIIATGFSALLFGCGTMGTHRAVAPPPRAETSSGAHILELEAYVLWSAVGREWRGRRDAWIAQTANATAPEDLVMLLVHLETNIVWNAVVPQWKQRRESWVGECCDATTSADVVRLLVELESAITWGAVSQQWRQRRAGWLAGLTPQTHQMSLRR